MPTSRSASPCRPAWCTAGAADMICRPASSTRRHFFPITTRKLSCLSRREPSDYRQHLVAGRRSAVVDAIILFGAGLLACYYGFGSPPVGSDPATTAKWQQWHKSWSRWLKISGVCLLLFGL